MSVPGGPSGSAPRWLSSEELAAWRGFVRLVHRLPAALEAQLQQDSRLSFVEYHVLAHLSEQPGRRIRMSELAALADTELSRLSHMIGRLEKRALVRREPDPDNGRYTQAILTDAGFAYLAEAAPAHVGRVRDLFVDALTPEELGVLHQVADKVLARIEGPPAGARRTRPRPAGAGCRAPGRTTTRHSVSWRSRIGVRR
ncbi:MarR family transcriptional regulator [Actinacidiphila sp. DG2A-62]|uniref:MarR family winged helix-turn-helix transcriptional regulator n=1 Tax=Actinacidiphila sp. DG2A-62 TaxID=3108821 RepID=UPI002DBB5BCE|nr:MarR family transcriptional regulator [Actinacidiphila sp. DG2A-62]MEC3993812.1 MarR family transcriptional regulator [Actinacidiphila sp. DG2A-62]